jgi:Zn-dependent M28 family amino/carboxypeptidase
MKKLIFASLFSVLIQPLFVGTIVAEPVAFRPNADAKNAAATINPTELPAHIRFLSTDLLEGRGPGSKGDQLAQNYIASQFEMLGLKPAAPNDSYIQSFNLTAISTKLPKNVTFKHKGQKLTVQTFADFIGNSGTEQAISTINNAEIVFVGYGIEAPEYNWDDYKGMDLKGKILLMMNNDPASDPKIFAGNTRLYYGRWTYKYEMAAKKGAAGAIVIHTHPSAGYPWQVVQSSWSSEQFYLPREAGELSTTLKSWITEEAAKKLATLSGNNLDELRAAAEKTDFKPVPLGTTLSLAMQSKFRTIKTGNVLGMLPGSDQKLANEVVVYTAHHDHLGIKENAKPGEDNIYNGALDNAAGVSGLLSIARAYTELKTKPSRSILFAAVAAEEQQLLGSSYLSAHPIVEAGRIAANINMDGASIWGPAHDITQIGKGKSNLDSIIESIAKMQGRYVKADQFPDRGSFYRSDQLNFAKIGVPAAYFKTGIEIIGKPVGWGKEQVEKFESTNYHQPSDELNSSWDFTGAVKDFQLNFYLGYQVAMNRQMPRWNPGDEFEETRLKALAKISSDK